MTIKFYLLGGIFIGGAAIVLWRFPESALHVQVALTIEVLGLVSIGIGLLVDVKRAAASIGR